MRARQRLRLGIAFLGGWALLLPGYLAYRHYYGDDAPPWDGDMKRVKVRDEDNGFLVLEPVLGAVYWPDLEEEAYGPLFDFGGEGNPQLVATEILKKNEAVLKAFDDCMKKPQVQLPEVRFPATGDYGLEIVTLHLLLRLRTRGRFAQGDVDGALEDLFRRLDFAHRIQQAGCSSSPYWLALSVKLQALEDIRKLLPALNGNRRSFRSAVRRLRGYDATPVEVTEAAKARYRVTRTILDGLAARELSYTAILVESDEYMHMLAPFPAAEGEELAASKWSFKPNRTKRMILRGLRQLLAELPQGLSLPEEIRARTRRTLRRNWHEDVKKLAGEKNVFGQGMYLAFLGSFDWLFDEIDDLRCSLAATRTLLALKAYTVDRNTLPADLKALVPDYLESLPLDPYSGEPLKYSRKRRIIYSVGPDGQGTGEGEEDDVVEPTFRIGWVSDR